MDQKDELQQAFAHFWDTGSVGAYLLYACVKRGREAGTEKQRGE